jgi:hypothetical protein
VLFNKAINEIFNNCHTQATFMADAKRYRLDGARLEVRTWYACLGYVRYFADDLELFPRVGSIIEMERIVSDAMYFRRIAQECVGEALMISEEDALKALETEPLARHSGNGIKNPEAVFQRWEPWQRESFQRAAQERDIASVYGTFYPDVISVVGVRHDVCRWQPVPVPLSLGGASRLDKLRSAALIRKGGRLSIAGRVLRRVKRTIANKLWFL